MFPFNQTFYLYSKISAKYLFLFLEKYLDQNRRILLNKKYYLTKTFAIIIFISFITCILISYHYLTQDFDPFYRYFTSPIQYILGFNNDELRFYPFFFLYLLYQYQNWGNVINLGLILYIGGKFEIFWLQEFLQFPKKFGKFTEVWKFLRILHWIIAYASELSRNYLAAIIIISMLFGITLISSGILISFGEFKFPQNLFIPFFIFMFSFIWILGMQLMIKINDISKEIRNLNIKKNIKIKRKISKDLKILFYQKLHLLREKFFNSFPILKLKIGYIFDMDQKRAIYLSRFIIDQAISIVLAFKNF